jgi:hypothetical protein
VIDGTTLTEMSNESPKYRFSITLLRAAAAASTISSISFIYIHKFKIDNIKHALRHPKN